MSQEAVAQPRTRKQYAAVFISPEVKKSLAIAKIKNNFRSYDELIMHLLRVAGYLEQ
jgi:hypothetical protein